MLTCRLVKRAAQVLALAALALVLHADVLFGGRAYFRRDIEHFHHERLVHFAAAIRDGAWPLWDPFPAFGEPMLAVANMQAAYPSTWLALLFSPDTALSLSVALHTFLASLGAWGLARELGVSRAGALVAGATWTLSGPVRSCVDPINMLTGASLIAWAWLGFARAARSGRPRDALLAGVALAGCVLGGSPESALMSAAGVALVFVPGTPLAAASRVRRAAAAGALAAALGAGLAAVQWLPTAVLAQRSARAQPSPGQRNQVFWSNHPLTLAQVLLPLPFDALPLKPLVRGELFEGREPLLPSLYSGLATAGLALVGLLGSGCRGRGLLAIGSLLAYGLSLGRFGPLWELAGQLPVVGLMRYPSRFAIVAALPVAILAGAGVDALRGAALGRVRSLLAALALGLPIALALVLARPDSTLWPQLLLGPEALDRPWADSAPVIEMFRSLRGAVLFAVPVALALLASCTGVPRAAVGGFALLAGAGAVTELATAQSRLNASLPRPLLDRLPAALEPISSVRPNRTFVLEYSPRFAGVALGREHALPRPYGVGAEVGFEMLRRYPMGSLGRFGGQIESVPLDIPSLRSLELVRWIRTMHALAPTVAFPRILELSGVQYLLVLHDPAMPESFERLAATPGPGEDVLTLRVRNRLPRVFAVGGVRPLRDDAALTALLDPGFDARREVVLPVGPARPPSEVGSARLTRLGFDRVTIEAEMEAAGLVVMLEAWDPGWRAEVDGQPAPLLRANQVFRAVPVPAGRHLVEMRYRPPEVSAGVALSLSTLLGLGLYAARSRAARRSSSGG